MHTSSVHLQKIPDISQIPHHSEIVEAMSFIRKVCNSGLSIRKKNNIKSRIPLSSITIAGKCDTIKNNVSLIDAIKDEINVKSVIFLEDLANFSVKKTVNLDASKIAKRLGKDFQQVLQLAKSGIYETSGDDIQINGHTIFEGEYEVQLTLQDSRTNYTSIDGKYLIILDTEITQELQNEGIARDFIRVVQNTRKELGLNITDYITLTISSKSPEITQAITENAEYIKSQVLGGNLSFATDNTKHTTEFTEDCTFTISKVS